jgi:ssDNA-specific exonuclease RecJ
MEKGERSTDEFKKDLTLTLPVHLKKMSPIAIAKSFELIYKHNLMTDYLFFDHMHHIFWKRFKWFVMEKACP